MPVRGPSGGVSGLLDERYRVPADPSVDLAVLTTIPDGDHPIEVFDLRAAAGI